jgi:hypothetical protein
VFEAVAGAAAGEPEVLDFGMAVDEEVAVGGVFVLADAGFG